MRFQAVRYLAKLFNPAAQCECCDHHFEGEPKADPLRKSLRAWFESLGWKKSKSKAQALQDIEAQGKKQRRVRSYLCLGKKKGRDVQHCLQIPGAARAMSAVDENQHANKCAVRQILDAMFVDIVEKDSHLDTQPDADTQCFLVHILSDIDPEASFLSRYKQLPPRAADMDIDNGLSFASTWLQNSLGMIKIGYESGETRLQMPFAVLETDYQTACARAAALKRKYPGERAVVITLDLMTLKDARLVASAEHAFAFLRVLKGSLNCGARLLLWAENDNDGGRPCQALLEAVLTIVEWKESGDREEADDMVDLASHAARTEVCSEKGISEMVTTGFAGPSGKEDSVITERALFEGGSKTDSLYADNLSTCG
ncbi:hypothetical protein N0V95_000898 [Ascochyta clinopodiicola]|nr:hypothetical protein N0V95_000898 [Ascochyta clinopodiicola]